MSEPISALKHAAYRAGIAEISEIGPLGMITLRGDLKSRALQNAAIKEAGVKMPGTRRINLSETGGMAWMSPDELLILCPYAEAGQKVAHLTAQMAERHVLAVNVSDARAVFDIAGPQARHVLAKLAPVDMAAFQQGDFRRTRMAQIPAAFWMLGDDQYRIMCFRSVAQYMFDLLSIAAQPGSEVTG